MPKKKIVEPMECPDCGADCFRASSLPVYLGNRAGNQTFTVSYWWCADKNCNWWFPCKYDGSICRPPRMKLTEESSD